MWFIWLYSHILKNFFYQGVIDILYWLQVHNIIIWYFYTKYSEKAMAPHPSTLAWTIPWMEEPGGLQSMGSRLSDFTFTSHFHALEKEMATHSSVPAWRIPGMAEPDGRQSMGSHEVGHDWSDLAAVAAVYVCVLNHFSCVQLFATLWTEALQTPLSIGLILIISKYLSTGKM